MERTKRYELSSNGLRITWFSPFRDLYGGFTFRECEHLFIFKIQGWNQVLPINEEAASELVNYLRSRTLCRMT